jgi:hypothetical protein
MSDTSATTHTNGPAVTARPKRKRSPSVAKPAFFVIQVLDETGQPVKFDKSRIKLITVERNPEVVMDLMDNETHPYAFYLRGIVPVQRQAAPMKAAAE